MARPPNDPSRVVAPLGSLTLEVLKDLAERAEYQGYAKHKLRPGDYGLHPPQNPRPSFSVCDDRRAIRLSEAQDLLARGILLGMVSRFEPNGTPKYVWSVDAEGEVYEAKTKAERESVYHGYRLSKDDKQRDYILVEWRRRCSES